MNAEWKLDPAVLFDTFSLLAPHIHLFTSRLIKQLECYVSYQPDLEAYAINAFSLLWKNLGFYAFPPFSIILNRLGNAERETQRERDRETERERQRDRERETERERERVMCCGLYLTEC